MDSVAQAKSKDIEYFIGYASEILQRFYLSENSAKAPEDFKALIAEMAQAKELDGDKVIFEFSKGVQPDGSSTYNLKYASMIIALTYLCEAVRFHDAKDEKTAWVKMAEGMYWSGACAATIGIDAIREKAAAVARRESATRAGQGRGKTFAPLKDFAWKQFVERKPKIHGWKSFLQAGESLSQSVLEHADEIGTRLSPDRAAKTIAEWLSEVPDARKHLSARSSARK
ncbi:hypothetical protein [Inhella sp.]|uniref:hypothetical protein n=1 Tax=Inhella sp. TaxID=1921806 RepID=UPI0035B03FEB